MSVTTLDPTWGRRTGDDGAPPLAPRPASLRGLTVGFLMNRLADCETMFDALGEELRARYGIAAVIKVMKGSQSVPPTDEQWEEIRRADVVVTGFGGCGSCSTRSMRDALDLEDYKIPAVCVGHAQLLPGVRAMTKIGGRPDYEMLTIDYPHAPIAKWPPAEAAEIARSFAEAVHDRLVA